MQLRLLICASAGAQLSRAIKLGDVPADQQSLAERVEECYLSGGMAQFSRHAERVGTQRLPLGDDRCIEYVASSGNVPGTGGGSGDTSYKTLYMPRKSLVSAWDPTVALKWKADAADLYGVLSKRLARDAQCMRADARHIYDFRHQFGIGEMMIDHAFCMTEMMHYGEPLQVNMPYVEWAEKDSTFGCTGGFKCWFQDWQVPNVCNNKNLEPLAKSAQDELARADSFELRKFEQKWGGMIFSAALMSWWWRPQPNVLEKLAADAASLGLSERADCIAVHVRASDNCYTSWRSCTPFSEYMEAATKMQKEYGFKQVYLASDNPNIIAESQQYTDFDFVYQSMDRQKYINSGRWHEFHIDDFGKHAFYEVMLDIYASSRCRAFVGSFEASIAHLIVDLMTAREGMIVPYASVGGRQWCRKSGYASCCQSNLSQNKHCEDWPKAETHDCATR